MRIRAAGMAVALAAGLVSAAGPAAASATTAKLDYTCAFDSGTTTVGVTVTATFPDQVTAGKAFRPTDVRTAMSVPRTALADLGDATSVSATTQLTVKIAQGGQTADAGWFGKAPATPVPASGDLGLAAAGDVPTVTVHGDGPVTFTAAALDLTLTQAGATEGSGDEVSATCTPATGQRTLLARLTTTGGGAPSAPTGSTTSTSTPGPSGRSRPRMTPGLTTPGGRSAPAATADSGSGDDEITADVYKACRDFDYQVDLVPRGTYAAGLANVRKLGAAAVVGYPEPGLLHSYEGEGLYGSGFAIVDGSRYSCSLYTASLDHQGRREFPIATSTSSAFGFVPVTANAHISQVGDSPVSAVATEWAGTPDFNAQAILPFHAVATATVSLRLSDVRINGVPLDVGTRCRTSRPLYTPDSPLVPGDDQVVMTGGTSTTDTTPMFGNLIAGGATGGDVTIPPFTGCVTPSGDNLNRLLTASVSGPGNHAKLAVGPLCPGFGQNCDAANQIPGVYPTWSLTHGGRFDTPMSETPPLTFAIQPTGAQWLVSCANAHMSGTAYNYSGPARGNLGSFTMSGTDGCPDDHGGTWTVKELIPVSFYPVVTQATGAIAMRGTGEFQMKRTAGGKQCSITASGAVGMIYDNSKGALTLTTAQIAQAGADMSVVTSSCPDEFPVVEVSGGSVRATKIRLTSGGATLPPDQAFTLTNP